MYSTYGYTSEVVFNQYMLLRESQILKKKSKALIQSDQKGTSQHVDISTHFFHKPF